MERNTYLDTWGMPLPQASWWRGCSNLYFSKRVHHRMSFSSIRKLGSSRCSGSSGWFINFLYRSWLRRSVLLVERDEDNRVNLLLILCIILQNINKNNKTRGTDQNKRGQRSAIKGLVVLGARNIPKLVEFQQEVFLNIFLDFMI